MSSPVMLLNISQKICGALPMPAESNPFLGVRGLRLGLRQPEILSTQLRAILRVASDYPVKAMLPMVATVGGSSPRPSSSATFA